MVSARGIECDPDKIQAVKDWPVPCSVTQVRQFLGFAAYYRKFISHFSETAQPLTNLTKKSIRFYCDEKCQHAFETLKQLLVTAPVLAYPTDKGDYDLDTDASNYAMGAVLSQVQNGEERVIAYACQTLSHTQQNYCTTKKEFLAVVTFIEHFRYYLYGRPFTIRTDHASLRWLHNFKTADGMLARWLDLQEGNSQQEVHVEAGEQPVSDIEADSESLIEGRLGTSVQPEDLQLPDDHNNSDEDSSELNPSPIPSTSRDPNLPPLDRELGSRCSSRPRKPKIQADYFYY